MNGYVFCCGDLQFAAENRRRVRNHECADWYPSTWGERHTWNIDAETREERLKKYMAMYYQLHRGGRSVRSQPHYTYRLGINYPERRNGR